MAFSDPSQPNSEAQREESTLFSAKSSPATRVDPAPGLLDAVLGREPTELSQPEAISGALDRFLSEPDTVSAIRLWLGSKTPRDRESLALRLSRDVAAIDRLLNRQLNEILHAPRLQQFEASWRGLYYLVGRVAAEEDPTIKVRVLDLSWRELTRDFERAIEFDQSQTWRKVYENEFGMPGGEPFGVLLADYEVRPRVSREHPYDDVRTLDSLSAVAAASFCPTILGASPAMFGVDHFSELEHATDQESLFQQPDYLKWRALRDKDDARFLGLTAPRVLMREPYRSDAERTDRFLFEEDVAGPRRDKHLWGTAVYAYGGVLVRAFAQAGWLADIRGARRGFEGGGLVVGLPRGDHGADQFGLVRKQATDLAITDRAERQLSELGFLPLCASHDAGFGVFPSSQSIQKPATYDRAVATTNARISSMLQYMLCVSRFAHYAKVLARDKLGSFAGHEEFGAYLDQWISAYVTPDSEADAHTKARYPLRDASVRVEPNPAKPGSYRCQMHLQPHYELDDLQATVRVVAELASGRSSA